MAHRLFRHTPTGRWVPLRMPDGTVTPGRAYVPELAARYGLLEEDIEVLDGVLVQPDDFETNQVPRPAEPPPPAPRPIPTDEQDLQAYAREAATDSATLAATVEALLKRVAALEAERAATPVR